MILLRQHFLCCYDIYEMDRHLIDMKQKIPILTLCSISISKQISLSVHNTHIKSSYLAFDCKIEKARQIKSKIFVHFQGL